MAMEWWKREPEKKPEPEPIVLPKEIEEKFAKVDGLDSKLSEMLTGLTELSSTVKADREEREAEKAARIAAQRKTEVDQSKLSPEDLAAAMFADPEGTVNQLTKTQSAAILELTAQNVKRDLFENTEKFEFYTGELKADVDKLLANQPLSFRTNPANIENVYYTVLGRRSKEINEGKIKSRFASSTTSTSSKSTIEEEGKKIKIDITDDVRKAAKLSGMTPEAYADLLSTEAEEGNIAYV
jgi:hypothetical protein